jgi:hypothetical protein
MSSPAQLRSTEAIEAFSLALARFAERVGNALDALDADVRRADGWIDHDRPAYWKKTTHEAEDSLHQAKLDLEKCLLMTTIDGQRPACREQKDAVQKAKVRLDYCREKLEVVTKWQRTFRHDSMEYRGRVGQLRRLAEQGVPNARASLAKILHQIEQYQLERPPEAFNPRGESLPTTGEAMTRAPAQESLTQSQETPTPP